MIGYYVHHQGRGHVTRMRCIASELSVPLTVLSSLPPGREEPLSWVWLPRDDDAATPEDVTAHGRFHWVPRRDQGLARRAARVAAWIAENRPDAMVVDVSVEAVVLSRLCGAPVVVVAMPGRRDDAAHTLAYDLADAIIAPWPDGHETGWPDSWTAKTMFAGAISRFDGWPRPERPVRGPERTRRGLLLWGTGGDGMGERVLASLQDGAPEWDWTLAGLGARRLGAAETWRALGEADVVVTHAGQGSLSEVAAARRPAVVIADDRPFDEQRCTARRLARADLAVAVEGCPAPHEWPGLLASALSRDPRRWATWNPGNGAVRAARCLESLVEAATPMNSAR